MLAFSTSVYWARSCLLATWSSPGNRCFAVMPLAIPAIHNRVRFEIGWLIRRALISLALQTRGDAGELVEGVLEVFDDLVGDGFGVGETVAVFEAVVFDPE